MKSCLIVLILAAATHAAPQYLEYAVPTVLPDGHLADTPEVAASKLAHFDAHARAIASDPDILSPVISPVSAPDVVAAAPAAVASAPVVAPVDTVIRTDAFSYFANPVITPEGFVADTAEVSKAKAIHYAAHAAALGAPIDPYLKYLDLFA